MSNQERLKSYLLGDGKKEGYLKSDLSKGKIIMLSGAWGSGKTHFWQNVIEKNLNTKSSKIPNHYVSLYGKTSIDEIKMEIFLKVFESVDSDKVGKKVVESSKSFATLVSMITKTVTIAGVNVDLKDIKDKPFDFIEKLMDSKKLKKTEEYLKQGAVICFDDFERKSKEIDLNDLFGFITQLTLQFDCKVVIIVNAEVFEDEEEEVFFKVKEKSVSKFLKYEPSVEELFELIFNSEGKYEKLDSYKNVTLKTLQEVGEINARIYMQVLDNLLEWIEAKQSTDDKVLRSLILANINFILYHTIGIVIDNIYKVQYFDNLKINYKVKRGSFLNEKKDFETKIPYYLYFNHLKSLYTDKKENREELLTYMDKNRELYMSEYFLNHHDIFEGINDKTIEKINNFIETGILSYE